MKIVYYIFFSWLFYSCVVHTEKEVKTEVLEIGEKITYFEPFEIDIEYAKEFSVDVSHEDYTKITISTNNSVHNFTDSIFIAHNSNFKPKGRKVVKGNYSSLALQSSTYLAYLEILNKLNLVKGISGLQYVNSENYIKSFDKNNTKEISIDGKIQMESLLSINPDLFLIYPFELDNTDKYNESGVKTLLVSEYLETTALGKLEWIKFFGLIFGEYEKAEVYFEETRKNHFMRTQEVEPENTMFFNLPFKDDWNMPSSNSTTVNLTNDAGFNYIYKDQTNDNSHKSKEEVWNDAMQCKYWIIIASRPKGFSLADLLKEEEVYKEFPSVKNGRVIFCNTVTTEYFTKGVVEPDILLKELIYAKDNIEFEEPKYFRILK